MGKKRTVVAAVGCVLLGAAIWAGLFWRTRGLQPTGVAGLYVDTKRLDFGPIRPGTASGSFHLHNRGNRAFRVIDVKPDCGCATAKPSRTELAPGQTLDIPVTLVLAAGEGELNRKVAVRVRSEAGTEGGFILQVAARADPESIYAVWPGRVDLGVVRPGEQVRKTIFVRATSGAASGLPEEIKFGMDSATRVLSRSSNTAVAYKRIILVMTVPASASAGVKETSITFEFQGPKPLRLVVPVRVQVISKTISASASPPAEPGQRGRLPDGRRLAGGKE